MESYTHIEQDYSIPGSGDNLPTYDQLAEQSGPNSRFGRWRGWIEKRAAERYHDITPEERKRRRQRGWGNDEMNNYQQPSHEDPMNMQAMTNTLGTLETSSSQSVLRPPSPPLPPLPPVSQKLGATHLKLHHFGSRFLPHTTCQIRCLLPLLSDRMLLIGHDEGLSVLDMYPQDISELGGGAFKGPEEAIAKPIWQGEGVYQMTLLEVEQSGDGTPQGVVLLLVGPEPGSPSTKEPESQRTLRMYNLASLISLVKYIISQKTARPVDLHRSASWMPQTPPKKQHRAQGSIARGLKHFVDHPTNGSHEPSPSYSGLLSPSATGSNSRNGRAPSPTRQNSDDSTWDVVEDLPLRWATDYVPLASNTSRLLNLSVITYAIWDGDGHGSIRGRLLAVATKGSIFLYETPKGERAFRFVKEFYTPLHPRSIAFFQQTVSEFVRSPTDSGIGSSRFHHSHHKRSDSTTALRDPRASTLSTSVSYGTQLSLFVIFDKKAGWIRLADSAVGEVDLYDDGSYSHHRDLSLGTASRKSRSFMVEAAAPKWILPALCELPVPSNRGGNTTRPILLMTRGKQTQIFPSPLPISSSIAAPIRLLNWKNPPSSVIPRIYETTVDIQGKLIPPYLQLISLGDHGIEIQEIPISLFSKGKGKSKAPPEEPIWTEEDIGGDTGFLCNGGHWNQHPISMLALNGLNRSFSTSSSATSVSIDSLSTEEQRDRLKKEQGIYGWCRKGPEDYRIFWLGSSTKEDLIEE